jgi:alpha-tubulin suppressor-like RCC1 family protein
VSLKAAANTVTAGDSLRLSGTVTHPRAGTTSVAILVQDGVRWRRLATTRLSAKHRFTIDVTLDTTGTANLVAQYAAGSVKARSKVVAVSVEAAVGDWLAVAGGSWGGLGRGTSGSLWAWGSNDAGQLGLGAPDADPHATPEMVGNATDWAAVAGGGAHAVALRSDGSLWAWGSNDAGQLGLGEAASTVAAPTQVGGDTDWAIVAGGDSHTLALQTDSTLWGWGYNGNGQLGLGDKKQRLAPTKVGNDSDWAAVSCGNSFTLAVKKDGSLWAWGYNGNGQLGLADTTERLTPIQVGLESDWTAVSCGDHHTLALKKDGTLWAWGWNGDGQLGIGDTDDRVSPTQAGGDTDWTHVSAGQYFSLALKADGSLWAWGDNANGQLGLGDTTQVDTPAEVVVPSP